MKISRLYCADYASPVFSCQAIVIAIEFRPEEYRWASLTSNQLGADRLTTCLRYEGSSFKKENL